MNLMGTHTIWSLISTNQQCICLWLGKQHKASVVIIGAVIEPKEASNALISTYSLVPRPLHKYTAGLSSKHSVMALGKSYTVLGDALSSCPSVLF